MNENTTWPGMKFVAGRIARDLKSTLAYPIWALSGKAAPDNHVHKKQRIERIAKQYGCRSFIETGTFYGQMVNFASSIFDVVVSIEIFEPFFERNAQMFAGQKNVKILLGDSSAKMPDAMALTNGRILFWLDGHFSGEGTGLGDKVSPIIEELRIIAQHARKDHCIIIDDRRLFTGVDGYPSIAEATAELRAINPDYTIDFECDCIIATPRQ